MNKRDDNGGMIKAAMVLLGIIAVIVMIAGAVMEFPALILSGIGVFIFMIPIAILQGFHNILLDIRDQAYEQTEILKAAHSDVVRSRIRTIHSSNTTENTQEELQQWKSKWRGRITEEYQNGDINLAFYEMMKERIESCTSIPHSDDLWYDDQLRAFMDDKNNAESKEQSVQDKELNAWKTAYIEKVNLALASGKITKEKADAVIHKVNLCTEIPQNLK